MVKNFHKVYDPRAYHAGIFCSGLLVLVLLLTMSFSGLAQARAKTEDARKNFGFVKRGTVVSVYYDITNVGNEPLIISKVEVACSCTTVEYPKEPLVPGGHGTVTVTFNTTTVYGRQDRVVLLYSNDGDGPLKLRFKANVSTK